MNFARPFARTKQYSRSTLGAKPSFRVGTRSIPIEKFIAAVDEELIGFYTNPTDGGRAVGLPAGLAYTIRNKPGRSGE